LESLGVLAGGIAHDFNNLLSGILGNTSLALLDAPANSSMRHYLEQIEVTSHRAAELAQQMLAYSGKGRFVVVDTNLSELVEEMTKLLMVSIASGVEVRYDLARDLPSVHADVTQMRQLIMNLVLNAADAIGEESGVISISTGVVQVNAGDLADASLGQDQPAGEYAFIEVTDSGCGMTPDTLARVFDPFFSGKPNGRGLGLAAVQGIVAGHSGALQVRTQPGHGTTFKLLLPAVPRPTTSRQDAAPPKRSPMAGSLVLVADDNDTVRTTIGRMLERLGCRTLLAEDGKACVDLFREHMSEIDVVLLDMTMPKLGGKEAFGQIRRIKPTAKVILMSGYHEHDATSHFAGKGLGGFLQKPFRIQDLVEYLNAPSP
jgi:CheY-like chemotaxis protein